MFHNSKCTAMSSDSKQGSPPFHPKDKPLLSSKRSPQLPTSGSIPLCPDSPITKLFQPLLSSSGSFQRSIVQEVQSSPLSQSVSFPPFFPFFKYVPSSLERTTSPPLPDGPLHTTRSDTSGSSSEDEDGNSNNQQPVNDIRGTLFMEEKIREEDASRIRDDDKMRPHIPGDESWIDHNYQPWTDSNYQPWINPNHQSWIDPNYQSWIPSCDKSRVSDFTESDDGEMNAFDMEDDSFLFEDVPDDKKQQVFSSKATCNDAKIMEGGDRRNWSDFIKEFEVESKKPPAIVQILSKNDKNEKVKILDDKDEVVVVIRRCMVRTTKEGIEKARRDWEEEFITWEKERDKVKLEDEINEIEFDEEEEFINEDFHENGDIKMKNVEDIYENDIGYIKLKMKHLNKIIRAEERKKLINERLVNDLRNKVNNMERKVEQLEGLKR